MDRATISRRLLALPVLAVGADHGYGEGSLRTMRQVAADPEHWMAEDCGHYVPEERPRELAAALIAFFRRANGGGGP